jgi:hypothetical protein
MVTVHLAFIASTPVKELAVEVGLSAATSKVQGSFTRVSTATTAIVASKVDRASRSLTNASFDVGIVVTALCRSVSSAQAKELSNSLSSIREGSNSHLRSGIVAMIGDSAKMRTEGYAVATKLPEEVSKLFDKLLVDNAVGTSTNCEEVSRRSKHEEAS